MQIDAKKISVQKKGDVVRLIHYTKRRNKLGKLVKVKTYQVFKYLGEQLYKHAHGQDVRRKSKDERAKAAKKQAA